MGYLVIKVFALFSVIYIHVVYSEITMLDNSDKEEVQRCLARNVEDLTKRLDDFTISSSELKCLELIEDSKRQEKSSSQVYQGRQHVTEMASSIGDSVKDDICKDVNRVALIEKVNSIKQKNSDKWKKVPTFLSAKDMYCADLNGDQLDISGKDLSDAVKDDSFVPTWKVGAENEIAMKMERIRKNENNKGPILNKFQSQFNNELITKSGYMHLIAMSMMGALWMMPESVTKWDKSAEIGDRNIMELIGDRWKENVQAGPVVDKDEWVVNYVGHPLSGAYYYMLARKTGLSKWKSFFYSTLMSSLFWEYGYEALAEVPSVQDLILTPILGSILGEMFYKLTLSIQANNGQFLGSQFMGSTAIFLMDPLTPMTNGLNSIFGSCLTYRVKMFNEVLHDPSGTGSTIGPNNVSGIKLEFSF